MDNSLIAPLSRIVGRYVSSALVTYGAITPEDAAIMDPDIALAAGVVIGFLVEGAYALARARGWAK